MQVQILRKQLVNAYKKLCKYEGHVPIVDHEGETWCELCEEKIGDGPDK